MNWEPSFIWQDSNDRTMSPDFLSTSQDTSWEPSTHPQVIFKQQPPEYDLNIQLFSDL